MADKERQARKADPEEAIATTYQPSPGQKALESAISNMEKVHQERKKAY